MAHSFPAEYLLTSGINDPFVVDLCESIYESQLYRKAGVQLDAAGRKAAIPRLIQDIGVAWLSFLEKEQTSSLEDLCYGCFKKLHDESSIWRVAIERSPDLTWDRLIIEIKKAAKVAKEKAVATNEEAGEDSYTVNQDNEDTFDRVYDAVYTQLYKDSRLKSMFKDRPVVHELWSVVREAISDSFEDVQFDYENDVPGFVNAVTNRILPGWAPDKKDTPGITTAISVAVTRAIAAESMGSEDENGHLIIDDIDESDILAAHADGLKAGREAHEQAVKQQIQDGNAQWRAATSGLLAELDVAKTELDAEKAMSDPHPPLPPPREGVVAALAEPAPSLAPSLAPPRQAKASRRTLGFGLDELRNLQSMFSTDPRIQQLSLAAEGVKHASEVLTEIVLGWTDRTKQPDMKAVEHAPAWVHGVAENMAMQEIYCDLYRKKQIKKTQIMAWVLTGIQGHLKREQLRFFEKEARYIDSTVPSTKMGQDLLDFYMSYVVEHPEYQAALESHHPVLVRRVLMAVLPRVKNGLITCAVRNIPDRTCTIFVNLLHEMSKYPRFMEQITTKKSDLITEDVDLAVHAIIDRAKHRLIVDEETAERKLTDIKPPKRVLQAYLHHLCANESTKLLDRPKSIIVDALLDARRDILANYVPNDGRHVFPAYYEEVFVRLWQSLKFRDWMQSTEYGYSDHELDEIIGKAMLMTGIHSDDKQKEGSVNEPQQDVGIPEISEHMWASYLSAVTRQPLYDMGTLKTPNVIVPIIVNALREAAMEGAEALPLPIPSALEPYQEVFAHLWLHVPEFRAVLQDDTQGVETATVEAWVTEAVRVLASVSQVEKAWDSAGLPKGVMLTALGAHPIQLQQSLAEKATQLVSNDHAVLSLIPPNVSRYALQGAIQRALAPLDTPMSPEMIRSLLPAGAQELLASLPTQGLLREPKKIIAAFNIDSHGVVSRRASSAAPNDVMKPMEENEQGSQLYFGTTNGKNLRFCISTFDAFDDPEYPDGYVVKYAVQHDSENPDEVPPEVKEFFVPLPFTELDDAGLHLCATKLVNVILNQGATPDFALIPREDIRRALHRRITSYLAEISKAVWPTSEKTRAVYDGERWISVVSAQLKQDPLKPEHALLKMTLETHRGLRTVRLLVPSAEAYSKDKNTYASKILAMVSDATGWSQQDGFSKSDFTRALTYVALYLADQAVSPLKLMVESTQVPTIAPNEGDHMANENSNKEQSMGQSFATKTLTQEETFMHARKREMGQVLKRTGARQLVKFMQEEIAAALRRNIDPTMQNESVRVGIATFLEGDLGKILVGGSIGMLGAGLIPIPEGWAGVLNPLFEELRIEAGAQGGDMAADMIGGPVRKALARWIQNEGPKYAAFKDLPGVHAPGVLGSATGPEGVADATPSRDKIPSQHDK